MRTSEERSERILKKWQGARRAQKKRRIAFLSSACALLLVVSLVLFVPYDKTPDKLTKYAKSEYYDLINTIYLQNYVAPTANNRFESLLNFFLRSKANGGGDGNDMNMGAPMEPGEAPDDGEAATGTQKYEEVTDNQEAGVIEGDLIKRSDRYVYYLADNGTLYVYEIAGTETACVGTYSLSGLFGEKAQYYWMNEAELFLSADCSTVTVAISYYDYQVAKTLLISLDVRDPASITERARVTVDGRMRAIRSVNGKLLIIGLYHMRNVDFDDPKTFVPSYEKDGESILVAGEDILLPETSMYDRYTVVTMVDEATLELCSSAAVLSCSETVYVSENAVYVTQSEPDVNDQPDNYRISTTRSEIAVIGYGGDGLDALGVMKVAGEINDQYAMDEKDGVLRVVSTVTYSRFRVTYSAFGETESMMLSSNGRYACLTCVDLSTMTPIGRVNGFASGETVTSVRFREDLVYVCTAEMTMFTDPVFVFDLSDPKNIKSKDTGTIDGYSTSLIELPNGDLLGIGFGEDAVTLKVEVYRETEDAVVSVDAYEWFGCSYATDYHAYLIDRENGYFGIPIWDMGSDSPVYILLSYDGETLTEEDAIPFRGGTSLVRGLLIDGYFYLFMSEGAFTVMPFPGNVIP